jgi:hypothetical protein
MKPPKKKLHLTHKSLSFTIIVVVLEITKKNCEHLTVSLPGIVTTKTKTSYTSGMHKNKKANYQIGDLEPMTAMKL